jgi:hypothetical protein
MTHWFGRSAAVWTGSEMVVWGGEDARSENGYSAPAIGARYWPATDTWKPTSTNGNPGARAGALAAWTGTEMLLWGGARQGNSEVLGTGARYSPSTDAWKPIAAGGPPPRYADVGVWTGQRFVIWGGWNGTTAFGDGSQYDPTTDSWAPVSMTGAPTARSSHVAVWTGKEIIVWGGSGTDRHVLSTGARYDPSSDAWNPISDAGAPSPRMAPTAVWTGTKMLVWGGFEVVTSNGTPTFVAFGDGGAYDPATDTWSPLAETGAPEARFWHTAAWTGTRMVIWGGTRVDGTKLASGGLYDPATGTWQATAVCGAAAADTNVPGVWTGKELLLLGSAAAGAYTPP